MSLVFADSFEHFANQAQMLTKWDAVLFGGTANPSTSAARFGTQGLLLSGGGLRKNVPAQATYIVGCAVNLPAGLFNSTHDLFLFQDAGTTQTSISINSDGSISARRNGRTVI